MITNWWTHLLVPIIIILCVQLIIPGKQDHYLDWPYHILDFSDLSLCSSHQHLTLCVHSSVLQQSCPIWKLVTNPHPLRLFWKHEISNRADFQNAASLMAGTSQMLSKHGCHWFHVICCSGTLTRWVWCRQHSQMTEEWLWGSTSGFAFCSHSVWLPFCTAGNAALLYAPVNQVSY